MTKTVSILVAPLPLLSQNAQAVPMVLPALLGGCVSGERSSSDTGWSTSYTYDSGSHCSRPAASRAFKRPATKSLRTSNKGFA